MRGSKTFYVDADTQGFFIREKNHAVSLAHFSCPRGTSLEDLLAAAWEHFPDPSVVEKVIISRKARDALR